MITTEEMKLVAGLHTKKLAVMNGVERLPKNGHNKFQDYHYATEGDIVDALRTLMVAQKLSYRIGVADTIKDGMTTKVIMSVTLIDAETGYSETDQWVGWGDDKGDKGGYKAYTGAQKYALMKAFMLSTGDDPEAAEEQKPTQQPRATQKPQPRQPAPSQIAQPQGDARQRLGIDNLPHRGMAVIPPIVPSYAPAEEEEGIYVCESCNAGIKGFVDQKTGEKWTSDKLAESRRKRYGKILCTACVRKIKAAEGGAA